MLTVEAKDVLGKNLNLGEPMSVVLNRADDVPADFANIKVNSVNLPELMSIAVYRNDKVVFSGEIDEQIEAFGKESYTEFVARDSAARLIDSEAYPKSFVNPSAKDIFDSYAKPLGFSKMIGENKVYSGKFTVDKETSCYSVIRTFAMEVYGTFPKCNGDKLYIEGYKSDEVLHLGGEGAPVTDMRVVNLRCNRVSRVYLKYKDGQSYNTFLADESAEEQGINKVRYINLASQGSSLKDVDVIFDEAKKKSFYADVVCRGFYAETIGKTALIDGVETEYYISSARYVADKKGEFTKLKILRKEG